jgi:beta-1,2-mannobiose phosphorylase / 1,2-beta-oligomannan phosphorylase
MYEYWAGDLATHSRPLPPPQHVADARWSIWISYCQLEDADWAHPLPRTPLRPPVFSQHQVLVAPQESWESMRLGAGTPPIRLAAGWLLFYHGVEVLPAHGPEPAYRYSAGAVLLDAQDPRTVLYRSPRPVLEPGIHEELHGVVGNVVFPTAVDQHDAYLDVYYGMADAAIGAARMTISAV